MLSIDRSSTIRTRKEEVYALTLRFLWCRDDVTFAFDKFDMRVKHADTALYNAIEIEANDSRNEKICIAMLCPRGSPDCRTSTSDYRRGRNWASRNERGDRSPSRGGSSAGQPRKHTALQNVNKGL